MYATLSPPWKKSLLLVFVSVVAFVTATPATSGPQCFFQGLGFLPGGNFSGAFGVSANGTVVVGSSGSLPPPTTRIQAFRWTAASGMVGLGFLPGANRSDATGVNADGTVVVGVSGDQPGGQAFRWVNGTMTGLGFLPGANRSDATGVNADGTVVVGGSSPVLITAGGQAFRWVNGTMTGLGFLPGGNESFATGVNADGTVVVGLARDASGAFQASRWTAETRMQSVLTLLQAAGVVTMAGWQLRSANGVSADGTVIVGDGVDPLGNVQAWIARLPEDNEDCKEDENELEGARSKRLIMEDRVLGY